jgi:hypothetical protein
MVSWSVICNTVQKTLFSPFFFLFLHFQDENVFVSTLCGRSLIATRNLCRGITAFILPILQTAGLII